MFDSTGVATRDMVMTRFPEKIVLVKPKAIIECYEEIPCNPCETSCPFKAITIGPDINVCPTVDFAKCTGCGICVTACPGLAISIAMVQKDKAILKVPYELLPLPKVGDVWDAIDRGGNIIGKALIKDSVLRPAQDKTVLVTFETDIALLYDVITVRCPR